MSLDQLTPDQRATVYDWLLDLPTKEVVEKIAQPAPEGFGIKTHLTTLRRFKDKYWAELAADREESAKHFAGTTPENSDELTLLDNGIQVAIRHHMFQRVSTPDCTDAQLALVSRWSHRQEKLKLEVQRVQIARERCAQNQLRLELLSRRSPLVGDDVRSPSPGSQNLAPANQLSRDDLNETIATPADPQSQNGDLSSPNPQLSTNEDNLPNLRSPHHCDDTSTHDMPSDAELRESLRVCPSPLPFEVIKQNALHSCKMRIGEIKLITTPDNFIGVEYCNPADQQYFSRREHATFVPDPTRTTFLPALVPFKPNSSQPTPQPSPGAIPSTDGPNHSIGGTRSPSPTSTSRDATRETTAAPADPKTRWCDATAELSRAATIETAPTPGNPNVSKLETGNSKLPSSPSALSASSANSALCPAELAAHVDRYTTTRMREHIAHDQRYTPWPHRHSPPEYNTQLRHCPCGHQCPCPIHESKEFGPFPEIFWKIAPTHPNYAAILAARNLPFRFPKEFLA